MILRMGVKTLTLPSMSFGRLGGTAGGREYEIGWRPSIADLRDRVNTPMALGVGLSLCSSSVGPTSGLTADESRRHRMDWRMVGGIRKEGRGVVVVDIREEEGRGVSGVSKSRSSVSDLSRT